MENIVFILYLAAFLSSFIVIGYLLFHFWHMNNNLIGKYSGIIGVFCLFMPSQFNEIGNHHRRRVLVFLPLAVLLFIFLAVGGSYMGFGS